ncbi:MAG: PHP domain-containing protein [Planctomycetota bacterium]|nr:PHP domain-containing protein [Planctomycetota bacterium]
MSDGFVDLHVHSTASDGTFAPAEVARLAKASGLAGFALTDHDTVAGVAEAGEEAKRLGLEFLVGIEISVEYPRPGTLHMLGYGVDTASEALRELSVWQVESRNRRNPRIVQRLRELGVAITMEEVEAMAGSEVVGRPHVAEVLVRKGYVGSAKQAFDKYLGQGGSAYENRQRLPARRAMELIARSGGVAVLAHPVQLATENDAQLERVVKDLVDLGLGGIEVIHSDHSAELVEKYTKLAERFGLLKTGGSDFHGVNKKEIQLGVANGRRIPRGMMDELLKRGGRRGFGVEETMNDER